MTLIELDDRRRASLGKVGRHNRYIAREEEDGTVILEPAVILTEFEAKVLGSPGVVEKLRESQSRPRPEKPWKRPSRD